LASIKKLGIILIVLSMVSMTFSLFIMFNAWSMYLFILSTSFFIALFIIGLVAIMMNYYMNYSKHNLPSSLSITEGEKERSMTGRIADERIENIKNDIIETIQKLKEIEMEE